MAGLGTWRNPYGPLADNVPKFFEVPDSATFTCDTAGARCSFVKSHYEEVDIDPDLGATGLTTLLDGNVWTVGK